MQQKEYKKNVLISAFNCSPYAGSEQYLGWSSAVATANYGYRTYVLTIDKTKQEIEKWFEEHDDTRLKDDLSFVYVSIPNTLWKIKGRIGMLVRYRYFQKQCVILGKELEKKIEFYYCHHVSWASFVQKIELYKLNAPLIIGPVGGGEKTPQSVEKGFETGEYPMVLSGSWTIGDLQTNYKDIDFGILPYPVSDKTKKLVSPSGSWQLAVTTKSDKKEAAAEFVKFATNTESSEILSLGNSVLPIRKSTIKNIKDKVSEPMRFLMEQNAKTAHARPVVVAYPQVSRAFQQAMQDISYYKDNPDVQKVLDARAKEMQTAIDQSLNK